MSQSDIDPEDEELIEGPHEPEGDNEDEDEDDGTTLSGPKKLSRGIRDRALRRDGNVAGGPQQFAATKPWSTPLGVEEAHRELRISPAHFDEGAAEFGRTLDFFKVREREKTRSRPHSRPARAR